MNAIKARKRVRYLDSRRRKLQGSLLYPGEMIRGSLYEIRRSCGNPRCRCARGEKHVATCLSLPVKGKKRLVYVRREDHDWVRKQAASYRDYQKAMAEIRKINEEIVSILAALRDTKTRMYK